MVYGFAFTNNNISTKTLYKLNCVDHCYILWGNNIKHYLNLLLHDQPEFILGLGAYSGVDHDRIRIETHAINNFRNEPIELGIPVNKLIPLDPFLKPVAESKIASGLGNSWSNLVSWKIANLISQNLLRSQYAFLHIPNRFPAQKAVSVIENMLGK